MVHMDATTYDNPAGRLHSVLQQLREVEQGTSLVEAWKAVLPASGEDVPERLAEMSVLLKDVQQAVEDSGSAGHTAQVRHYRDEWEVAIFPRDRPLTLAVQEFWPSELGLVALQSAAEYLHEVAPEGKPLEDGELDKLRSQAEGLIEETKAATDLDDDVKQLIVARLRDIIRALDHVNVGGPKAVKLATQSLAGAIDLAGWQTPSVFSSKIVHKVAVIVTSLSLVFGTPAAVQADIVLSEHALHALMPPSAQIAGLHHPGPASAPSSPVVLPTSADGDPR